jgi:hypothetical protein
MRRRRAGLAAGVLAALAAALALYAYGPGRVAPPPDAEPVPAASADAAPEPAAVAAPAPPASPPLDPRRQALDQAWRAAALPDPPAGWLDAYAAVAATPCARLELAGGAEAIRAVVTAVDAEAARKLAEAAGRVAGVAAIEHDLLPQGSPVCDLLDGVNRSTLPSPAALARLEPPRDGRCARPPCYAGVSARRLRAGERLVLRVVSPPVAGELAVSLLLPDGTVRLLHPPEDAAGAQAAGETLWLGDARAGAGFIEHEIGPPFGRAAVLVLAAQALPVPAGLAAGEPLAAFLERLRALPGVLDGPALPLASLLILETTP